jgi:catechol-2,3-dioxygenase
VRLDTIDELVEFRQRLIDAGARTGESSHGATKSVHGMDPDGNEFEIMWMLPAQEWGANRGPHRAGGVAARLFLGQRTVEHHLRDIFTRLGVRSRVEPARQLD